MKRACVAHLSARVLVWCVRPTERELVYFVRAVFLCTTVQRCLACAARQALVRHRVPNLLEAFKIEAMMKKSTLSRPTKFMKLTQRKMIVSKMWLPLKTETAGTPLPRRDVLETPPMLLIDIAD